MKFNAKTVVGVAVIAAVVNVAMGHLSGLRKGS